MIKIDGNYTGTTRKVSRSQAIHDELNAIDIILSKTLSLLNDLRSSDRTTKYKAIEELFEISGYAFAGSFPAGSIECAIAIKNADHVVQQCLFDRNPRVRYYAERILEYASRDKIRGERIFRFSYV